MAKNRTRPDVSVELVVRRGALRRFHKLKEKAADLPVNVTWDRREGERRTESNHKATPDQRKADRRQKPPFTWDMSDFVVVARTPARKRK
jgi:hypothetical protein